MASRYEVEITLSSAKDLKNINWRSGPLKPYAIAYINPDRKVTTRVDDEGDTCPQWDQSLMVPLDGSINNATITIEIVHRASEDEDIKPLIGTAKLSLCDIGENEGARVSRSLKLKRPSGRPHGKLEVEVTIRAPQYRDLNSYPPPQNVNYRSSSYDSAPPAGYPAYGQSPAYGQPAPYGNPGYGEPTPMYGNPSYGQSAPAHEYGYGYDQGAGQPVEEKKSKFGGMGLGTGIAIGAAAGIVGGIALSQGYEHMHDSLVDDIADQVKEDLDVDDDKDEEDEDDE
ncbi:hypothetical protein BVRB_3g053680 [Beta vulgaris subsp. vulgaris]|uniref:protein SRC2 homolog n=1 Tax=Beta vulgaris subsp. vulgaris TaxID=3555 RepID=UPI00053F5B25|nr:protein SRC2 homolog [Beta vulgaris subsp. vulgaris]KMT16209.1 hypothetical protein BVRB_3g053680 [Beta vulgaris subsp. vulgaris]